jgi:hypothetical protein
MFINFNDYIIQILDWCQLNCLNFKNHSTNLNNSKKIYENDILDDWVDYGFGKNDVIH